MIARRKVFINLSASNTHLEQIRQAQNIYEGMNLIHKTKSILDLQEYLEFEDAAYNKGSQWE